MARKKKKIKHFTLMIIPHGDKEVRKLKVPRWLRTLFIVLMVAVVATTIKFTYDYRYLKDRLGELEYLEDVSRTQAYQIEQLRQTADVIKKNLQQVEELDGKVRELVGLEEPEGREASLPSRGGYVTAGNTSRNLPIGGPLPQGEADVLLDELSLIKLELDLIIQEMPGKQQVLVQLKEETEERLSYLAAVPSTWPLSGRITSGYGYRKNPFGGGREFHEGLDIAARSGSPVVAAADGKVVYSGYKSGYGRYIEISHGYGFKTGYGHNSSLLVKEGQTVKRGQVIARVGSTGRSTGPHLHFEVIYQGKTEDPLKYLP